MNKRMLVTLILSVFVLGSLFAVNFDKADLQINPNVPTDENFDANQRMSNATASREMWDLQFDYDIDTGTGTGYNAGAETDGQFLYTTVYNTNEIAKWQLDGTFVELFTIPGVTALRDLAYDGTYFYGSDAGNYIWEMDFDSRTLISTITAPGPCRAIAYDEGQDAFWINEWDSDLLLVDRSGNQLDVIASPTSMYGCAYDPYSAGGPYLWYFTGTTSASYVCHLEQFDMDGVATGVTYDVYTALGDGGISGGVFIHGDLIPGVATIGGCMQGQNNGDRLFGFELCDTFPSDSPGPSTDLTITPDASGALSADLAWTNPSLTHGGTTLTELTEVRVYRDGALVHTITNPTIGGDESWTDNAQPAAGLYNYAICGYNTAGEGAPLNGSAWVGEDVPAGVTGFALVNDEGDALLTWTNPTTGLHGGAFNQPIQGFTLVRNDGSTFDITGAVTTFTDDTIPADNNYYYTITPYNSVGEGGAVTCDPMWIGNSVGVSIGTATTNGYLIPINYFYRNSITETIYMAEELSAGGITEGALTNLIYYYNFTEVPTTSTIDIWVGETTQTSLSDGWIDTSQLLHVYHGDPVFTLGEGEVVIAFDVPYVYSGDNLVVMLNRPYDPDWYDSTDTFYFTETSQYPGRTLEIHHDTTVYDPYNLPDGPVVLDNVPNTTLLFNMDNVGALEGHVYDSSSALIEGVEVALDDPAISVFTDAAGYYLFPGLYSGDYTITASKLGYDDVVVNDVTVTGNQTTVEDITLPALLNVTVTGFVDGSEAPGTGIDSAYVQIDGYDYFETYTIADGTFEITDVYANEIYDITVSHDGYQTYQGQITVGATNYDCGTITLTEVMIPVNGLDAEVLGNDVYLTWNEPTPAFFWDLEDNDGDFVADPITDAWAWGADDSLGAYTGTNAWVTGLNTNYPNDISWTLDTPEVSIPGEAQLTFWMFMDCEFSCDGGNIKISTDSGENWTLLTPVGDYDDDAASTSNVGIPGEPCFSGHIREWEFKTFDLSEYANTNAMIRFHWGTDYSVVYPGWAIDDVRIGAPEERVHLGYNVYRNSTEIASVGPDVLSYDDMDLEDGAYTYDVTAEYTSGESDPQTVTVQVYPIMINGYVELSDNQGVGAEGVQIVLENEDLYYATTTAAGNWSIDDVFGDATDGVDYTLTMSKENYEPYTTDITVYADDIDHGTIILTEFIDPVAWVQALENAAQTQVDLTWSMGGGTVNEMRWDDGINDDSIGLTNGGTFTVASRWTPTELAPYNGFPLTQIEVFCNDVPTSATLKVWTGGSWTGTAGDPGTEVLSQELTGLVAESFNTIVLDQAVLIDASQELWFGWEMTHDAGSHICGIDAGPSVNYYGNLLFSGTWTTLLDATASTTNPIDDNWNLAGYCVGGRGELLALGQPVQQQQMDARTSRSSKHSLFSSAGYGSGAVSPFILNANDTQMSREETTLVDRSLEHYWLYRLLIEDINIPDNWVLLTDTATDTVYTDTDWATLPAGTYTWAVLCEYTGGFLSDPVFSNEIVSGAAMVEVSVTVTCDDAGTPNGAEMVWAHFDGLPEHTYSFTVPANGEVEFDAYFGNYNVTCGLSGYEPFEANGVNATGETFTYSITLNELTPPVQDLTIEAEGASAHLVWLDPFTAQGWTEDFEGGEIPEGWTMTTLATGDYPGWFITQNGSSTNWTIPAGDGYYACSNDDFTNPSDGSVDYLITPVQDLSGVDEMSITFDSYFGDTYSHIATFEYTTDGGDTWTIIETLETGTSGAWDTGMVINLDDYTGAGFDNVQFGFHSNDDGGWLYGWCVDNVMMGDGGERAAQFMSNSRTAREEAVHNCNRSLLGYHIERTNTDSNETVVVADLVTDLEYFDTAPETAHYVYHVYASYTTGLSEVMDSEEVYLVGTNNPGIPEYTTSLGENYPNPFNPETSISFSLAQDSDVRIDIFNVRGQKVRTLVNEHMEAGKHSVVWQGQDDNGQATASGIYFYKMRSGRYTSTKKMILLK